MQTERGGTSQLARILAVLGAFMAHVSARADCPSANKFNFSFANQTAATLSYGGTYNYSAASTALGSRSFSVSWTTNGVASAAAGGVNLPAISNLVTDGVAAENLVIGGVLTGRTSSITGSTRVIVTKFTFATPIRDFTMQVNDIDYAFDAFRDWIHVSGVNGAGTYVPTMSTTFGNNNSGSASQATGSSVFFGPSANPPASANEAGGISESVNNSTTGTISIVFPQPVTEVRIRYGNYSLQSGETQTQQQAFGIQSISFCPVPQLTVTKTATPLITDANDPLRFNVPGADVIYSLTVANSDSSPVDVDSMQMSDLLPTSLTFYNGDMDGAGPVTSNYDFVAGASGLTLAASNLAYTNDNGATYAYSPVTGYDANVKGLRFSPQGAMAANSSFTVRFRARIK